jgi:ABC-type transport system involved in multi-copper enzyme maturation permease subunit
MLWLSWRQHRTELLIASLMAIGFGSGITLLTLLINTDAGGVHHLCSTTPGPLCLAAENDYVSRYSLPNFLIYDSLLALPGLAGIFIGAPLLAREYDQGTVRLIWTQGITRRRWIATKLSFVLVVVTALSGAVAVASIQMVTAQTQVFTSRWSSFDVQGLPFVAYAIFAIALGVAVGGLVRRVLPSMGITLAVFVIIRLAIVIFVRPNFLPPLEWDMSKPMTGDDAWNVGQRVVDLSGHPVSQHDYNQLLADAQVLQGSMGDYLRAHGLIAYQLYQPESRFWLFQNLEGGLFLTLAVFLIGLAVWSTRRA